MIEDPQLTECIDAILFVEALVFCAIEVYASEEILEHRVRMLLLLFARSLTHILIDALPTFLPSISSLPSLDPHASGADKLFEGVETDVAIFLLYIFEWQCRKMVT